MIDSKIKFQNCGSLSAEKMNSKVLILIFLLTLTAEAFVNSHILVGLNASIYKDGLRNDNKLRIPEFRLKKAQFKGERNRQLSKKIRQAIARMIAVAFNDCEDQRMSG